MQLIRRTRSGLGAERFRKCGSSAVNCAYFLLLSQSHAETPRIRLKPRAHAHKRRMIGSSQSMREQFLRGWPDGIWFWTIASRPWQVRHLVDHGPDGNVAVAISMFKSRLRSEYTPACQCLLLRQNLCMCNRELKRSMHRANYSEEHRKSNIVLNSRFQSQEEQRLGNEAVATPGFSKSEQDPDTSNHNREMARSILLRICHLACNQTFLPGRSRAHSRARWMREVNLPQLCSLCGMMCVCASKHSAACRRVPCGEIQDSSVEHFDAFLPSLVGNPKTGRLTAVLQWHNEER
jgi:hypothetical protein